MDFWHSASYGHAGWGLVKLGCHKQTCDLFRKWRDVAKGHVSRESCTQVYAYMCVCMCGCLQVRVCVSCIPWNVHSSIYVYIYVCGCVCEVCVRSCVKRYVSLESGVYVCASEHILRSFHLTFLETCTKVYTYMCVYVWVCACASVCTVNPVRRAPRFICLYICVWLCVWCVCVKCVCICVWRDVYPLSRVPGYVFVYVRVCGCECICACVEVYVGAVVDMQVYVRVCFVSRESYA